MAENTDTDDNELTERQRRARQNIRERVPDFVLDNGLPFETADGRSPSAPDYGPCHRCEGQHHPLTTLDINEKTRYVCEPCAEDILREIDDHYWYDRFRKSHYDVIAGFLESLDEVWCVHDHAYKGGEMFIHTGYATPEVVSDVLDFMGSLYSLHIEHAETSCWDCMDNHGDCIEIELDFGGDSVPLRPLHPSRLAEALTTRKTYDVDFVEDRDKLFDHDGRT